MDMRELIGELCGMVKKWCVCCPFLETFTRQVQKNLILHHFFWTPTTSLAKQMIHNRRLLHR